MKAIITGAARGIGAEVARLLARKGYTLGLLDVDEGSLQEFATSLRAEGAQVKAVSVDVRNATDVSSTMSKLAHSMNGIDVVINSAGVNYFGGISQCTEEEFTTALAINVGGYFNVTKAALPFLATSSCAHIINMSSVWALEGSPTMTAYATSKHAVEGFTKSLRKDVGPKGIKVTSLILDIVDTDFRRLMVANVNFNEQQRKCMLAASDVADAVAYVLAASPRSLPSTITLDAWLFRR